MASASILSRACEGGCSSVHDRSAATRRERTARLQSAAPTGTHRKADVEKDDDSGRCDDLAGGKRRADIEVHVLPRIARVELPAGVEAAAVPWLRRRAGGGACLGLRRRERTRSTDTRNSSAKRMLALDEDVHASRIS